MLLRPDVNITRRSYTKPQSLNAVPTTACRWAPMIITGVGIYIYNILYTNVFIYLSLSLYLSLELQTSSSKEAIGYYPPN
jgi:type IV secretory pathway VirB3-like protein